MYVQLALCWISMLRSHDAIPQSFLLKQMQTLLYKFQKYLYNLNWSVIFQHTHTHTQASSNNSAQICLHSFTLQLLLQWIASFSLSLFSSLILFHSLVFATYQTTQNVHNNDYIEWMIGLKTSPKRLDTNFNIEQHALHLPFSLFFVNLFLTEVQFKAWRE